MTLVQAPAGWGKTTLLSEWAPSLDRCAWLSLDPADNDSVRFWSYVVEALRGVAPEIGATSVLLLGMSRTSLEQEVLPALVNDLQSLQGQLVLVLDDYHAIVNPAIHQQMALLLDYLPASLHLVIATRAEPPLPLARLRARGHVLDIRPAELRFSADEAEELLNGLLGLGLAERDVTQLHERTEGWAAGLYLAALSLRDRPDPSPFIAAFAGDDRQIVDYLGAEVLSGQDPAVRTFLLRTSVLERLSGPLCDAVTASVGSAKMLREIERANLFVVPLDTRRHWYRYHHLFADLLRHELEETRPDLVPTLHRRASAWYQAQGLVPEAIRHAIAAGDHEGAVELIAAHWNAFLNQGRGATVEGWLDDLPDERARRDPRLCIARAWLLLDEGRLAEVEAWVVAAEAGTQIDGPFASQAPLLRAVYHFKAGSIRQASSAASRVLELEGDNESFARTVAACILGITRYWSGQTTEAIEALSRGAELARATGNQLARAYALGYLGVAHAQLGELDHASHLAETGMTLSDEPGFAEHFVVMFTHLALAFVHERHGATVEADAAATRAVELSRRGAGRVEIAFALAQWARTRSRLGDHDGAKALLDQSRAYVDACPDGDLLRDVVASAERACRGAAPTSPPKGGDDLSDRELAVLRLLATSLSRRDIASSLFVSMNTVKTHMRGIYRKLGASTRDEAIAHARDRGLL